MLYIDWTVHSVSVDNPTVYSGFLPVQIKGNIMFEYCEIVRDNVFNRGNILKIPVQNYDLDYYGKEVVNGFHSVFMHTEDYLHFDDSEGGKRGYSGNIKSFYLPWDFDNNGNLEQSRKDTVELCERIMVYDKRNIRIYFSGNKGFHVYYICHAEMMSVSMDEKDIKSACTMMASDLISFDNKVYNKTGIIRTTNSKHSVSGLYKIPLTFQELRDLSIDEIRELAKTQRKMEYNPSEAICSDLIELLENAKKQKETSTVSVGNCDADELLRGIQYGFDEGERNNKFASLAGLLHSRNLDNNFVYAICNSVNNNSSSPLGERELQTIVNSICRYRVPERDLPANDENIITMADAGKVWKEHMELSGDFSLGERYKHINDVMSVTLLGDLIGIVSNSGVGKSTICMDFANTLSQIRNTYSLFVSLEMSQQACFFRGATMSYTPDENGEVSSKEVAYKLLHDDEVFDKVCKDWNRMLIVDKGSISLTQLEDYAKKANDKCDGRLGSIIIDYAQFIDGASQIDKQLVIAREIKTTIKRLNVIGFLAMQCNKLIPNSYVEVEDSHVEGCKAWKQSSDYLMAFWKSREDKKRLHAKFLKTRWEKDDVRFDIVRHGLMYHSEDEVKEIEPMLGGI